VCWLGGGCEIGLGDCTKSREPQSWREKKDGKAVKERNQQKKENIKGFFLHSCLFHFVLSLKMEFLTQEWFCLWSMPLSRKQLLVLSSGSKKIDPMLYICGNIN